jgi:uncharacterized membrane protein (UPF0182 family)
VTYTDAHVTLTGLLVVSIALALGAVAALANAVMRPRLRWLIAALGAGRGVRGGDGRGRLVREQLHRQAERTGAREPVHRPQHRDDAAGLRAASDHAAAVPAETTVEAADAPNNQATLQNIRLWDWRALQDTLRQIQEIRTYYDFPDVDIDRYEVEGTVRQMMLAARELNVEKLPESSRNWINEKLIYTHGYGITMNPVNGFTPEGLPTLVLKNMPVESAIPSLKVTRPEIYFGELTDTDVYVKTRQKEFNYPQGETNSLTSYEGSGGIALGGFFRRLLIAYERGDLSKLPFSDDVTAESRLLMRRNIRDRVHELAGFFLTFDEDPYIVLDDDGRLFWMFDAYTTASTYPYARHFRLGNERINYLRNSVKAVVNAYDGATTFYVFDNEDPIVAAYRSVFPSLFKDASAMPPAARRHVRYPELLLRLQAAVYGQYHMSDPAVFYNKEDLWSVASEVVLNARREQATQVMDPNFVLMTLPGEKSSEFVGILPFTPANRNNLIGWIAGRSDDPHYGSAIVYNFPKTRLVDGPCRSRRGSIRTRSCPASCRCGTNRVAGPARRAHRDSRRPRAALRRTDLSAVRSQPDAGTAARGFWRCRIGSPTVRRSRRRWPGCLAARCPVSRRRLRLRHRRRQRLRRHDLPKPRPTRRHRPTSTRSSRRPRAACPTISGSPRKASWAKPDRNSSS